MSLERVDMLLRALFWRALARIRIFLLVAAIHRRARENRAAALEATNKLWGLKTKSLDDIDGALRDVKRVLPRLSDSGIALTVRMELLVGEIIEALSLARFYMTLARW